MKKLRLFLTLSLVIAVVLLTASCVNMGTGSTTQTCTVHSDVNNDGMCDKVGCGVTYTAECLGEHTDKDHDGYCDKVVCQAEVEVEHTDLDHDGKCDGAKCTMTMNVVHVDENHDGKCDADECIKRGLDVVHIDDDHNGVCDASACRKSGLEVVHTDRDHDGVCDGAKCNVTMTVVHKDNNDDGICDVCAAPLVDIPDGGCEECVDENLDGRCEVCKKDIEGALQLIANGQCKYTFVLPPSATGDMAMTVDMMIKDLKKLGITATKVIETANNETEYEVIFGVSAYRADEYKLDPHVYGVNGYAVEIIGNKIVVVWGADKNFATAINAFKEEILGLTSETKALSLRYVYDSMSISEIQDDYDVKTITLNGKDIRGFTIAANKAETNYYAAAVALQDLFYVRSGYWLDIVSVSEATENSIIIAQKDKDFDKEGYYVTLTDTEISFISEYPTVIQTKVNSFFVSKYSLAKTSGVMELTSADSYVEDVRYVYYQDYGAVGDGVTDDSEAIRAAHVYANQGGHIVKATKNDNGTGKTYYIGKMLTAISVSTNVDWGNATFLLDDRSIPVTELDEKGNSVSYRGVEIFKIVRSNSTNIANDPAWKAVINEINANGGIKAGEFTSFNFEFGEPLLLYVYNNTHKEYIRYGVNANGGSNQNEMILVDEHGNIDPSTPFMFDFERITSVSVYTVTDTPITVQGGNFKTRPRLEDFETSYLAYGRGIEVNRPNTTVKNVKHYLIEEGNYNQDDHRYKGYSEDYGYPYGGFFGTNKAYNILFKDCQMAGHITYWQTKGAGMGTYDFSPGDSVNVTCDGCYQEYDNFFATANANPAYGKPQSRWGVMGSSGCKNVTFINSMLTRFDAHAGIHNVNIINTEIKAVRVVGSGTFYMEGCTYHGGGLQLREDYGGFWHGSMILKNNDIIATKDVILISNSSWYNHYFGYPTAYPSTIVIDGIKAYTDREKTTPADIVMTVFGGAMTTAANNVITDYFPVTQTVGGVTGNLQYSDGDTVMLSNKNMMPAIEKVIIRNCGENVVMPNISTSPWFANTVVEFNKNTECVDCFDYNFDNKCDDCGKDFTPCAEHYDINLDGRCTRCWSKIDIPCDRHMDKDSNGVCDTCKEAYHCPGHRDENDDRFCDVCRATMCYEEHMDIDKDCVCDVCKFKITCVDADSNKKCDVCEQSITTCKTHTDVWPFDSICDTCGKEIAKCAACADADADGWCDTCHRSIATGKPKCYVCFDKDDDARCDTCGGVCEKLVCDHLDNRINPDGYCDWCYEAILPSEE